MQKFPDVHGLIVAGVGQNEDAGQTSGREEFEAQYDPGLHATGVLLFPSQK